MSATVNNQPAALATFSSGASLWARSGPWLPSFWHLLQPPLLPLPSPHLKTSSPLAIHPQQGPCSSPTQVRLFLTSQLLHKYLPLALSLACPSAHVLDLWFRTFSSRLIPIQILSRDSFESSLKESGAFSLDFPLSPPKAFIPSLTPLL